MSIIDLNTYILEKKCTEKGYIHTDNINTLKIITQKKKSFAENLKKTFQNRTLFTKISLKTTFVKKQIKITTYFKYLFTSNDID